MNGGPATAFFRPRLDMPSPSPWPAFPEVAMTWREIAEAAASAAATTLGESHGAAARLWDLRGAVDGLAAMPGEAEGEAMLTALSAIVHHRARSTTPRWHAGGLTNRANRRRWAGYAPFLGALVGAVLDRNLAASLTLRARAARLPVDWAGSRLAELRLNRLLPEGGEVAITARLAQPGGAAALAEATGRALTAIAGTLASRQPCLVELVRDPRGRSHRQSSPSSTP